MVVHAEDLVAGKIVCQLGLVRPDTVRAALRLLANAQESPAATLLNLLLSQGSLDKEARARVHRYTKLYQAARHAALETTLLKQHKLVPDAVVERALGEVERGKFERRVGEALVASGELGRAQDERLAQQVQKTLATEDVRLVQSYASADYEGVARSITKDRGARLDTGQFTVKKLFRSRESQRLARMSALASAREPVSPPTLKDVPARSGIADSVAVPSASDKTPPPAYAHRRVEMDPVSDITIAQGEETIERARPHVPVPPPPPPPARPQPAAPGAPAASPRDPFDEATGELNFNRVGPYLILRKLGAGTLGVVYLARRPDLSKPVALKVAPVNHREEALARFRRAATLARDVRHDALVQVLDQSEHDGLPLLALELVTGEPLRSVLAQKGPQSEPRALALAADMLGALVAVHAAGLVHRDLAPETIMVSLASARPRAKLPDLGLAVRSGERATVRPDDPRATYASPEELLGEKLDERSDLYSLGLVLFETLTKTLPFDHGSPAQLREQKLGLAPRPLAQVRPDHAFAPALEELLARLLSRDRSQRPPSAARTLKALSEIVIPDLTKPGETARLGTRFDELFRA